MEERDRVLKCPFCGEVPGRPKEIPTPFGDSVDGNRCKCGAVYVYDRTGRMLGETFKEALALAYDWDYDRAFSAEEGEYEEAVVRYNFRTGWFIGGEGDIRERTAKFYFIKRRK